MRVVRTWGQLKEVAVGGGRVSWIFGGRGWGGLGFGMGLVLRVGMRLGGGLRLRERVGVVD